MEGAERARGEQGRARAGARVGGWPTFSSVQNLFEPLESLSRFCSVGNVPCPSSTQNIFYSNFVLGAVGLLHKIMCLHYSHLNNYLTVCGNMVLHTNYAPLGQVLCRSLQIPIQNGIGI